MRRPRRMIAALIPLAAIAIAGCGSSGGGIAKIAFQSRAMSTGTIPAVYTCSGKNISPPLEWGTVPPGAGELALFVIGFTRVGTSHDYKASIEWAVAGINPALHKLNPGTLPKGVRIGRNSDGKSGYSLCPRGKVRQYQFELYAVSSADVIPPKFTGLGIVAELANSKLSGGPTVGHGGFVAAPPETPARQAAANGS